MKEFYSSLIVGVNQTLIGLPFDTVKVWIQNGQPIWRRPLTNYYKGAIPEFTNSILSNCLIFPIHAYTLPYTNNNSFISGAIAGLSISPSVYTFRSFKIYQQVGRKWSFNTWMNNKGRGYPTTCAREMVGYSIFFGSYSYFKKQDVPTFISGALAGLCNWGVSYPIDVVMSRQIAQDLSITQAIKLGKLYRGYGVCLCRSMIVNAFGFLGYENIKSLL
jgi:hypothetical protein